MTSDVRPPEVAAANWKNRRLVSAKLTHEQYTKLMDYCREHDYSFNSGLKSILDQFFNV